MCLHRTEHPSSCLCRLWEAWSKCLRAESHFFRLVSDDKLYKFTRNVSECQPAACQLLSFASSGLIFPLVTCSLPHEIFFMYSRLCRFPTSRWAHFAHCCVHRQCFLIINLRSQVHVVIERISNRVLGNSGKNEIFILLELQLLPRKVCWLAHKKCI